MRAEEVVDVPPHENGRTFVNRQAAQRVAYLELRMEPYGGMELKPLLEAQQGDHAIF